MSQSSPDTNSSAAPAIGAKTKLKGDLIAEEDLLIEGSLAGSAVLTGNKLTIGSSGRIAGQALAKVVCVMGTIEGDLYATELIEVRKGAKIKGNLISARISFEDGASLRGSVEMDPDEVQKAIREKFSGNAAASAPNPHSAAPVSPPKAPTMPSAPSAPSAPLGSSTQPRPTKPAEPSAQAG